MLPKSRRIPGKELANIFTTKQKKIHGKYLSLIIIDDKKNKPTRFATVISLKVSKKAVIRNKVKRRIFSLVKEILPDIKDGYKIIILTKKTITGLSQKEMRQDINRSLIKSGIVNRS